MHIALTVHKFTPNTIATLKSIIPSTEESTAKIATARHMVEIAAYTTKGGNY